MKMNIQRTGGASDLKKLAKINYKHWLKTAKLNYMRTRVILMNTLYTLFRNMIFSISLDNLTGAEIENCKKIFFYRAKDDLSSEKFFDELSGTAMYDALHLSLRNSLELLQHDREEKEEYEMNGHLEDYRAPNRSKSYMFL